MFFLLLFYPNEASGGEETEKLDPEPEKRQTPQLLASGSRPRKWMGSHHSLGKFVGSLDRRAKGDGSKAVLKEMKFTHFSAAHWSHLNYKRET